MSDNMSSQQNVQSKKDNPDFIWIDISRLGANSCEWQAAFKTQKRVLNELLPQQKDYSLSTWYCACRAVEGDDALYSLCGFVHPAEAEMLQHYLERWQKDLIVSQMNNPSFNGKEGDTEECSISVPRAVISNFLTDPDRANFMLENHENLLLRLGAVKKIVTSLGQNLFLDGVYQIPDIWVSAMDELVGQYSFPDQVSVPSDEYGCWVWMNRMTAPIKQNLTHLDLSTTQEMMKALNTFRVHKSFADLMSFAEHPECMQRVNGKLQKVALPWIGAKVSATLDFLYKKNFLDSETWNQVVSMSKEEREKHDQKLQRFVISSFVTDIVKSSPDTEMCQKLMRGFARYFGPILQRTGMPVVQEALGAYKDKKGHVKLDRVVHVSFCDAKDTQNRIIVVRHPVYPSSVPVKNKGLSK